MEMDKIAQMLSNVSIQNVHFNDIHDNMAVYVGKDAVSGKDEEDALLGFILDDKERDTVTRALRMCKDTADVARVMGRAYRGDILDYVDARSANLHRAILPLLSFKTTERALREAIIKVEK